MCGWAKYYQSIKNPLKPSRTPRTHPHRHELAGLKTDVIPESLEQRFMWSVLRFPSNGISMVFVMGPAIPAAVIKDPVNSKTELLGPRDGYSEEPIFRLQSGRFLGVQPKALSPTAEQGNWREPCSTNVPPSTPLAASQLSP